MYDKDLYNKIINASCSFEELEKFVIKIDKKEFDLDNAFEKYYDVERILYAISSIYTVPNALTSSGKSVNVLIFNSPRMPWGFNTSPITKRSINFS